MVLLDVAVHGDQGLGHYDVPGLIERQPGPGPPLGRDPTITIEACATRRIRPPARTCTRSHGSAGSPSSRTMVMYSAIGILGYWCLAFGRTGATSLVRPALRAASRSAATIWWESPAPRCAWPIMISTADAVSPDRPASLSLNAQMVTRSRPPSGSEPRPAAPSANCRALAVATTVSSASVATAQSCGNAPAICQYSAFATGSRPMKSGQLDSTS